MTEILIQEISIKEQKSMDENLRSRFVGEWLQNENVILKRIYKRAVSNDVDAAPFYFSSATSLLKHRYNAVLMLFKRRLNSNNKFHSALQLLIFH